MSENKGLGESGSSVGGNISQKVSIGIVGDWGGVAYRTVELPKGVTFYEYCVKVNEIGVVTRPGLWHSPNSIKNIELLGSN